MLIINLISSLSLILCLWLFIRNEWVYTNRREIANKDKENNSNLYDSLPTYNQMLFDIKFWRWNIKYYIEGNNGPNC